MTVQTTVVQSNFPIDPRMIKDTEPSLPSPTFHSAEGVSCQHPLLPIIYNAKVENLASLRSAVYDGQATIGQENLNEVLSAVSLLHEIYNHVCSDHIWNLYRAIFTWPVRISREFVTLLTNNNVLALIIYAYWLMLVILVEDRWYIDDMGRTGILEIVQRCEGSEPALQSLLEKPREMINAFY